jgi:non-specific serine/threonine protein kinase
MPQRAGGEGAGPVAEPGLSFAGLLRQLRTQAQLTQEELAEAASVSPRSVSDLERGVTRTTHKDTALLLAGALGLQEPARELFVAAARGKAPAAGVLTAGTDARPAAFAAAATRALPRDIAAFTGFPAALTSFVGRDGPVRDVAGLLEGHRLVTVTGPGGSGKTRLAAEVAKRVAGRFADGIWLAELALVADPALVASVVAAALGVREQPGVPAVEAVARMLARQQLLLVLDNCEHVIGAAAGLCAGLLIACDEVTVLATSREPLAVAGEARYRLAPLALPDPSDLAGAAGADAVVLFADRARSADARFALTGEMTQAVARLVTRLDGMPLAIELGAARVEALGVTELLGRLDDRFALLAGGDRLAPSRQRSLAATVEWSYQLLDETERQVFRAVSVFPGPFTLEAAEAVAGAGAGQAVLHLVDCSLLIPPRPGPDSRFRYGMLETLRAYGNRLLVQAGESDAAAAALAVWALEVAERASAGLQTSSAEEAGAARWLDAEDPTMRQVLAWAVDHDPAAAARLAGALGSWWLLRGRLPGQYGLLREAAGRAEPGTDGWCAVQLFSIYAALFSADQAAALEHATALRDATTGMVSSRALADGLTGRAAALVNMGRPAAAAEEARRSLAVSREIGYGTGEVMALDNLCFAARSSDDIDYAVQLARQAAQVTTAVPGVLIRLSSWVLTGTLIEAAELAGADEVCAAALAWSRDAGDVFNQWALLPYMVLLDVHARRFEPATGHLREGLRIAVRTGGWLELANGLDSCGFLCAATGRAAEAVTIWAAYATISRQAGLRDWPAQARLRDKFLRTARQVLEPEQTRAAEERGTAMSLNAAAEYALLLTEDPGTRHAPPPGLGQLSAREKELVTLVAKGRTDAQIAAELFISVRTVSSHLDRIRAKTGCRRRTDLTRLALTVGLV